MTVNDPDVGVAFGLVIGAGAATAIGASVVFFPSLVKLASKRVLASSLGISAGVMCYVSFVEIFTKSVGSFVDSGYDDDDAYKYATFCFFGGVIIMLLLNWVVAWLSGGDHPGHDIESNNINPEKGDTQQQQQQEVVVPHCVGCVADPAAEVDGWRHMAEEEEERQKLEQNQTVGSNLSVEKEEEEGKEDSFNDEDVEEAKKEGGGNQVVSLSKGDDPDRAFNAKDLERHENKKLVRMGINTALAIGLHNFPEGLATFVSALEDPKVGAVLAIAIGIHNIPEGLCVALPIYYATGNRGKAFLWALVSGVSEPIAALLGWAILANNFSDFLYATLFGLVAGMMVMISVKELLPTAHRYDPKDSVVTYSFIVGMVVMALSLVLFVL